MGSVALLSPEHSGKAPMVGPHTFPSRLLGPAFAGDVPPPRRRRSPRTATAKHHGGEASAECRTVRRSSITLKKHLLLYLPSQPETRHFKKVSVSIKGSFKPRAENWDQAEKHNKPEAISLKVVLKGT